MMGTTFQHTHVQGPETAKHTFNGSMVYFSRPSFLLETIATRYGSQLAGELSD